MIPVTNFSPFTALRKPAKKLKFSRNDRVSDKKVIGICSFEVASLMSKMIQLWNYVNDDVNISPDFIDSVGIENLLKDDNNGVLDLIYGEVIYIFCEVAKIIVRLAKQCRDVRLKNLEHEIEGQLVKRKNSWILPFSCKKMDENIKKMENLITQNEKLYEEMEKIMKLERKLKGTNTVQRLFQLETKIETKQLKVSHLKKPLWNATYDGIVLLLCKCLFTTFVRLESLFNVVHVYGDVKSMDIVRRQTTENFPTKILARLWSFSEGNRKTSPIDSFARCFADYPVTRKSKIRLSIFKTRLQCPPADTLGDAKLEQHYANAILEIDTLVMLPSTITEAKIHELKKMLPRNISSVVKERLKLVQNEENLSVSREKVSQILAWLTPLAHNTLTRWMAEQRYAHQNINDCGEELLLQVETLCFADKEKADAVLSELLVGLTHMYLARNDSVIVVQK